MATKKTTLSEEDTAVLRKHADSLGSILLTIACEREERYSRWGHSSDITDTLMWQATKECLDEVRTVLNKFAAYYVDLEDKETEEEDDEPEYATIEEFWAASRLRRLADGRSDTSTPEAH